MLRDLRVWQVLSINGADMNAPESTPSNLRACAFRQASYLCEDLHSLGCCSSIFRIIHQMSHMDSRNLRCNQDLYKVRPFCPDIAACTPQSICIHINDQRLRYRE